MELRGSGLKVCTIPKQAQGCDPLLRKVSKGIAGSRRFATIPLMEPLFVRTLAVIGLALLGWPGSFARGHDTLYLYAELHLSGESNGVVGGGVREIVFSVHAAELPLAADLGADPLGTSLDWLARADDAEFSLLFDQAAAFVEKTYTLGLDGEEPVGAAIAEQEVSAFKGGLDRRRLLEESARPGFLAISSPLPHRTKELRLCLSPRAGKRLLLVLNRRGHFPKVHDIGPGDSFVVDLSSAVP